MPENWNGLQTENDLDYAAQSLGFTLHPVKALSWYTLTAKPNYWITDPPVFGGVRREVIAYLLGFNTMRDLHHAMHNRDTKAILAVLKPFA